ncbi:response regulator [Acaryochloris marina]|uniref:response regulator n=1 Tax=Acaryochloris marina TaxID=155978 RepID=UPI0021C2D950|nr:response regulator [Acaryochloris marina]
MTVKTGFPDRSTDVSLVRSQKYAHNWSSDALSDAIGPNVGRPMMRILVVEDDQPTAETLTTLLNQCSYAVETVADGETAADLVNAFEYDLLLLDVMLPKVDGITLCRQLRNQGHTMPILLLTGKGDSHDKAVGLDAGADDYVVKPFDLEELEARIRALLRRGHLHTSPILEWGRLQLDPSSTQVSYHRQLLALTPKEYALLELLMRNPRRVFSCGMLLEHLWTYEDMPGEEAVRTHIKGLRHKLRDADAPAEMIETVYGIGYRLKPLAELEAETPSFQQENQAAIANIWQRYQARISQQVQALERASVAFQNHQGHLNADQQQQAEQEAHTLAGALGMFGIHAGTHLARQIEQLLHQPQPLGTDDIGEFQHQVETLRQTIEAHGPVSPADTLDSLGTLPSLLVIDADQDWMADLTDQARYWDWTVQTVKDLDAAHRSLTQDVPQVILMDPAVADHKDQTLAFLEQVTHHTPPIPVLFYGLPEGLHSRLEVARLGGKAFLEKPIAPLQVLQEVERVLHQSQSITAKVMIVDDDPSLLQLLPPLLEPWGFKVSTLADSRLFWQTLVAVAPDLLILDIEMPHVGGMDLCQIVRNDAYWHNLPIIFLTAHTEAETVNQIFALGADDFVSKPVVGPELVVRLVNRLERMQLSQQLWQVDTLTKAYKRQPAIARLEQMMKRAQDLQQPLSLALVKVTNLRQINAEFDLETGDSILRQVGYTLGQGCGKDDVVARWSSNEFLMGLQDVQEMEAKDHVQHLCQDCLKAHALVHEAVPIQLDLGVVQYPEAGTTLSALYKAADHHRMGRQADA